ncbi:MAG: 4Fe-4S binding protein [Armatimonadota bacterium]
MALIEINKELCKGCELCIHFCPKKLIEMADGFNSKGNRFSQFKDSDGSCIGCALCAKVCPDVAIEVWR